MIRLDSHERRLRKLECERRWVHETLSRIAESVAGVGERMTVMTQRFGGVEESLRELQRLTAKEEA